MNPDHYTFQQLREQDLLRFCLSSFVREQKRRSRLPACQIAPALEPPNPRSIIATPEMQFTDVTQIQYECNHVYADVLRLRAELVPLRRRRTQGRRSASTRFLLRTRGTSTLCSPGRCLS
jgi:hypothetical protein